MLKKDIEYFSIEIENVFESLENWDNLLNQSEAKVLWIWGYWECLEFISERKNWRSGFDGNRI